MNRLTQPFDLTGPHGFRRADGDPIVLAGLWERGLHPEHQDSVEKAGMFRASEVDELR